MFAFSCFNVTGNNPQSACVDVVEICNAAAEEPEEHFLASDGGGYAPCHDGAFFVAARPTSELRWEGSARHPPSKPFHAILVDKHVAAAREVDGPLTLLERLSPSCSLRGKGKSAQSSIAHSEAREVVLGGHRTPGAVCKKLSAIWSNDVCTRVSSCSLALEGCLFQGVAMLCELYLHGLGVGSLAGPSAHKLRATGSHTDHVMQVRAVEPDAVLPPQRHRRVWHVALAGARDVGDTVDVVEVTTNENSTENAEAVTLRVRSITKDAMQSVELSGTDPSVVATYRFVQLPDAYRLELSIESKKPNGDLLHASVEEHAWRLRGFFACDSKKFEDCIEGSSRAAFYEELWHHLGMAQQ